MAKKEAAGRPKKYNPAYANTVVGYGMMYGKLTTKILASIFNVSERTIRNWKSGNDEFRIACCDAKAYLTKLATDSAISHLKTRVRRREIVMEGGEIVELKEDVLPTHSDVLALKKLGVLKGEIEISKARVQEIYASKRAGRIKASEAIEELHLLSIKPPPNWLRQAEIEAEAEVSKEEPITKIEIVRISDADGNFINHDN